MSGRCNTPRRRHPSSLPRPPKSPSRRAPWAGGTTGTGGGKRERHGDKETRRQADTERSGSLLSPCLLVSLSPCLMSGVVREGLAGLGRGVAAAARRRAAPHALRSPAAPPGGLAGLGRRRSSPPSGKEYAAAPGRHADRGAPPGSGRGCSSLPHRSAAPPTLALPDPRDAAGPAAAVRFGLGSDPGSRRLAAVRVLDRAGGE